MEVSLYLQHDHLQYTESLPFLIASEQPSPVYGNRPRMSSFGKPNDKEPATPPTLPKADYRPTSPPNPITNGLNENRLFQKTQESLQYVQIAVDNGPTSPTSPRSNGSRPTQYAEVLLRDESEVRDKGNATPPPSLPNKRYRTESGAKNESEDDDDNIWIKNAPVQPELPPKARSKTSSDDSMSEAKTNSIASLSTQDVKPKLQEKRIKDWEKDLVLEDDQKELLAHNNDLTTFKKTTHQPDQRKSAEHHQPDQRKSPEHNTDILKPNYEDMTLNTPEKQQAFKNQSRRENYSPTKMEQADDGNASPGLTRRQLLSYEKFELKGRQKDAIQSMLITEVDQDIEAPVTSHNYENIHRGFEKEKPKDVQDYETMIADDNMSKYETMKRGFSHENIADDSNKDGLTDSYENVGVGASKHNSSKLSDKRAK